MAGKLVAARLGDIEFSVPDGSFSEIERATSWRIDTPEPIEGMGKSVHRGLEDDTITISGVAYPGFSGTLSAVERLRDAGNAGESLLLVDGEGTLYGRWWVVSVRERKGPFLPTGVPRRIEWTMTLRLDPPDEVIPL